MRPKETRETESRLAKQRQGHEPSGPLHMTTRRAASSVATNSATGSVGSNESRRNSLSEVTLKVGGSDEDSDRPAKIARLSEEPNGVSRVGSGDRKDAEYESKSLLDVPAVDVEASSDVSQTGDDMQVLEPTESTKEDQIEALGTPEVTAEMTKQDDGVSEPDRANANSRSVTPVEEANEEVDYVNGTEAVSVAHESGDNQSPEKQEPGGILKRLPGRRRAPHADPGVEAHLRRQLELKVAYRAVAKALKPVLSELAKRTARDLEANSDLHKEYSEYDEVMGELHSFLQQRLNVIASWRHEEEARLQRTREAEEEIIRNRFASKFRDLRDDRILECKHQFLSIIRDLEIEDDGDATDDEDGIIPRLYRLKYPDGQRIPLADAFDSRSRIFVQTAKLWDEFEHRHVFREDQREFDHESFVTRPKGFALYDSEQRAYSIASLNLNLLANAGKDIEDTTSRAKRRASNAAAVGLQALAEASGMAVNTPASVRKQPSGSSDQPQTPRAKVNAKVKVDGTPKSNGVFSPSQSIPGSEKSHPQPAQTFSNPKTERTPSPKPPPISFPSAFGAPKGPELRPLMPLAAKPFGRADESTEPQQLGDERRTITSPPPDDHRRTESTSVPEPHPYTGTSSQLQSPRFDHRSSTSQNFDYPARDETIETKPRKRPGPRAHYSTAEQPTPRIHNAVQDYWGPFNNSMGPPIFTPPYARAGETSRKTSVAVQPTSPIPGANFADHNTNQERHESGNMQPYAQTAGRRSSGGELRPLAMPSREPEGQNTLPPPNFLQPSHQSSFVNHWNPSQPYYQPNNFYGPFQNQIPPHSMPPQYSSGPPSSTGPHSASAYPPASPFAYPGPPPPSLRTSMPSHPFQPIPQFVPQSTTPALPPPPPSVGQSYQPYPPPQTHMSQHPNTMPQINMKHPGQVGHTPILPATLDPNRNRPPSATPTAASPPPFHPSGGGSMGVFSLYSPPMPNQETPLTPYEQSRHPPREHREKHPSRQQEHIFYSIPSSSGMLSQPQTPAAALNQHHHRHHSQADAHGFVHHSPWARPQSRQQKRRGSASSGLAASSSAKRDTREGSTSGGMGIMGGSNSGRDTPGADTGGRLNAPPGAGSRAEIGSFEENTTSGGGSEQHLQQYRQQPHPPPQQH